MTNALIRRFVPNSEQVRDPVVRQRYGVLSGAVGVCCNLFLFALKLVIGLITGSVSIAADAFNNLSDGLSCVISIVGFRLSGREPDAKHPFGYGRIEYIAGLLVSFLILLVGVEFLKTSIGRILSPSAVIFSLPLVILLAVSMLIKLWMGAFNRTVGRKIQSPTLMAAMQDSINDVISTAVVVIGMIAGQFTNLPVDGYIGCAVALFLLWAGLNIAKDTLDPLLGQAADPAVVAEIRELVLNFDKIVGMHDFVIHNYGAGRSLASLHAEVPDSADPVAVHEQIDEAERLVHQKTGVTLVIHTDPIAVDNAHVNALRQQVERVVAALDENVSLHDFRVVDGEHQINLIFDVVVPFSYRDAEKREFMITLRNNIKEIDKRYNPVVTFDHPM